MSRLSLSFHVASIPVVVEPGFWLIALLLGMSGGTQTLMIWIPAVFLGVLVHELGHAFTARAFGARPEITLYMMGGVTRSVSPSGKEYSRLQSALVTFAGPGAGFLLAAITFVFLIGYQPPQDSTVFRAAAILLYINLGWGILNLMPLLPLDGGNLLRAALSGPGPEVGLIRALWVSVVLGPLLAIGVWQLGFSWGALLFAFFTFTSGKQLLDLSRTRGDQDRGFDRSLEQAHQALVDGDLERAEMLARQVAEQAKTKVFRITAMHLMSFALLEQGKAEKALDVLDKLAPEDVDPFLNGACLLALDRPAEAIPHLERAAEAGEQPRALTLLIHALDQNGETQRADELRRAVRETLN